MNGEVKREQNGKRRNERIGEVRDGKKSPLPPSDSDNIALKIAISK